MIATETEIQHFLKIYLVKNLTKAARELHLSQPALTQSLVRLESKLEVTLFIRTKQGCVATEAAHIFFEKVRLLQDYWAEISASLLASKQELKGTFRLGCHPSLGSYTLPSLFKNLEKKAPLIELSLVHDYSSALTLKVIELELDCALVINPMRHPDLVIHKLGNDSLSFWKGSEKNIPKILFSDLTYDEMRKRLGNKKKLIEDYKFVHTESMELIRTLVGEGAGYGFLPERVARLDGRLKKNTDFPEFPDDICLIYRAGTLAGQAGKLLVKEIKSIL